MADEALTTIVRGATYHLVFSYDVDGVLADLTTSTVHLTIKHRPWDYSPDDETAVIKVTKLPGTHETATSTRFDLSKVDTWIKPGGYHYDIVVETEDEVFRPLSGTVLIDGGPTDRHVES